MTPLVEVPCGTCNFYLFFEITLTTWHLQILQKLNLSNHVVFASKNNSQSLRLQLLLLIYSPPPLHLQTIWDVS